MRFALVPVLLCAVASSLAAQEERMPVIRPQVETLKGLPAPFPFADKKPADFDTWIRTSWVQMNRAKCGQQCLEVTLTTSAGMVKVDTAAAKKGPARVRLGLTIPPTCGDYTWYAEMKDEVAVGAALTDPTDNPIEQARIYLFRFDERGREISMVFQNDHTTRARQARLNVLCKAK